MRYQSKHLIEYGLLRGFEALVCLLPYRLALALGWVMARFGHLVLRGKVREAQRRIHTVLPDRTPRDVARIAWIAWRNTVFNAVESLRLPVMGRAWLARHFDAGGGGDTIRAVAGEGGGLIAVPHMGNWELAGLACQTYGVPIIVILGKQRNPLANAYLRRSRERIGMFAVERGTDIMRPIIRQIRKGRFLAILPDSRMPYPDLPISFLGGTANLGSGMGLFARMTDSAIVPCLPIREGWTHHRIEVLKPVTPDPGLDKTQDIRRMTEAVMRQFDEGIRRYPEQWFWYNARWVLDPVG